MKKNIGRLKIAMIGHKRVPSREGGVEIVVEQLSTKMVEMGNDVTCYNRKGNHVSGKLFNADKMDLYKGVRIRRVWTINAKGLAAVSSSFFASICCLFFKYDIIHYHAEGPCAMMWIPKLFGKRCIATIHGLDHQRAKWGKLARMYIMAGERCAVKCADEIIVLSREMQRYFQEMYGRKTLYIPNGVDKGVCKEAKLIQSKYNLEKDSYILFLGRIVPEKGIHYLIEAYKNISTDKKLVIAGGNSDATTYMQELKSVAGKDENIIFTDFVQGQILEELYSNAYIYVLPSDLEGMPLSLLEALSYGNCCLVSDIPENTEVVEDKAIIFAKGNVVKLREKLQWLCDNQEVVEFYKRNATDFVVNKYCWEDITKETLKIYCKEDCNNAK